MVKVCNGPTEENFSINPEMILQNILKNYLTLRYCNWGFKLFFKDC